MATTKTKCAAKIYKIGGTVKTEIKNEVDDIDIYIYIYMGNTDHDEET